MLIRNILEESARKFDEVKAVKWLNKKEIMERSYGELMENVVSTRKAIWESLQDVPQQYRWMPHFPVRI